MEEKKIDKLYELLTRSDLNSETISAIRWAIFELESKYCKKE